MTSYAVAAVEQHIRRRHPGCPGFAVAFFAKEIASKDWRDASLGQAVGITMQTFLRHELTEYDTLLLHGVDRAAARRRVQPKVNAMLRSWRNGRQKPNPKKRGEIDARIALARWIEDRMQELGLDRAEFALRAGFFEKATLSRYLSGYSKLPVSQLPDVVEALELNSRDEGHILLMCLAQFYVGPSLELIERHLRSDCGDLD